MNHGKKEACMPNRDGTGPYGQGAMTGRGRGACRGAAGTADANIPAGGMQTDANRSAGRGMANRFGQRNHGGRGRCRRLMLRQQ